jgi:hypothetical protein
MYPPELYKYPRTRHIETSRSQAGDEDLEAVPWEEIAGKHLVVEEKLDGANCGISFSEGRAWLQSRGHFLTGGPRERHFNLLKTWVGAHEVELYECLGERYTLYGEWLYARHTVFYDHLPHYLMEFDLLDRETGTFLSTPARRAILAGSPVVSVPVVHEGTLPSLAALRALVKRSLYKGPQWQASLERSASEGENGQWGSVERAVRETDPSDEAEGLYIKVEEDGVVKGRYKWVRGSFLDAVAQSNSHWLSRPIVANRLAPGVEIF